MGVASLRQNTETLCAECRIGTYSEIKICKDEKERGQ